MLPPREINQKRYLFRRKEWQVAEAVNGVIQVNMRRANGRWSARALLRRTGNKIEHIGGRLDSAAVTRAITEVAG